MAEYYRDVMPPNEAFEEQRFPSRVWLFTVSVMALIIVVVPALVFFILKLIDPNASIPSTLIVGSLISLLVYGAGFTIAYLIFDRYYPVRIGPGGLCSYNGFGMNTRVRWQDIRDVKRIPVSPGVAYLLIIEKRPITTAAWIPLYLKDMDKFKDEVVKYAGAENPLSAYLAKAAEK